MESSWDMEFRNFTQFWVYFVFVPVVVFFGVLGNSLTIYILTRKEMRNFSNNIYLTALTISDLISLIFFFSVSWKHYDCMKSIHLYWLYIPFGLWITDASRSTSVWLTVSFTIERYMAVRHPMLTKYPYTDGRAAAVSSLVYPTCFLLTAATSLEWTAVPIHSSEELNTSSKGNETIFILANTDLGKSRWFRLIYHWFTATLFVFLPFCILATGNLFLISAVRASQKIRRGLISSPDVRPHQGKIIRQENRITFILVVIVIVFFVCQVPVASVVIYTSIYTPERSSVEDNVLNGVGSISNLLVACNSISNFILYVAISDKYKETFIQAFRVNSIVRHLNRNNCRLDVVVMAQILPVEDKFRLSENVAEIEVKDVILCASCCEGSDAICDGEFGIHNHIVKASTKIELSERDISSACSATPINSTMV